MNDKTEHPRRPRFNTEVSYGHVLQFVSMLLAALTVYVAGERRAAAMEVRLANVEGYVEDHKNDTTILMEIRGSIKNVENGQKRIREDLGYLRDWKDETDRRVTTLEAKERQ